MDITEYESQIISVLFHPQIVRYVKRRVGACGTFVEQMGRTSSHESVRFANTLPVGDGADNIRSHVARWLRKKRMHVVCSNFGVVDGKDSQILGSDMLLAYEPTFIHSSGCNPTLTMCTLMLHPRATPQEISSAYGHAHRLHTIINVSYNIRCRSVVLTWGLNGKLSESWL
jgi:hypothetical protein